MSIISLPYKIPIINITIHIAKAAIPSVFPNLFNLICNGVAVPSVSLMIVAIFPTSVFIPVSTTIPLPLPYVISDDENNMFVLSPIPTLSFFKTSEFLSTGTDSPVSDDSCDFKLTLSIILKSAGT